MLQPVIRFQQVTLLCPLCPCLIEFREAVWAKAIAETKVIDYLGLDKIARTMTFGSSLSKLKFRQSGALTPQNLYLDGKTQNIIRHSRLKLHPGLETNVILVTIETK